MSKRTGERMQEEQSMKLNKVVNTLGAEVILPSQDKEVDVIMACGCDLMSDVLAYTKPRTMLLTGLTTVQVAYTAEMADIKVICFVRGKKPLEETVRLAANKNLVLLTTNLPLFESCGRLYRKGLKGCSET